MKKYLAILSSIVIITSCDVEEGPFNTQEDCIGIIGGNTICGCTDTLALNFNIEATFEDGSCVYDTSSTTYVKKVLVEDFTGHLCPNCPNAARELDAIQDIYGDQVIGMALHVSKSFARPYPASQAPSFQYDFRTKWGDDWDEYYGISEMGLPRGMVNRIGYPDNHKLGKGEWAAEVSTELNKEVDFGININTTTHSITIGSKILNNVNGNYNLVVCLTENNIINWQKDGQENIDDYVHNHVLRTVLTDESLSNSTSYIVGQQIEKIINYDLPSLEQSNIEYSINNIAGLGNGNAGEWNLLNMSVVAYIYNTTTKEILQVEEAHLNN